MKFTTFHELFVEKLQKLYDGEQQMIQAMPMMIDACTSMELKKSFEAHFRETQEQAKKLEAACKELGVELGGKSNIAMEGMIEETVQLIQENDKSPILDAALIACAQTVEHYEIACYGTAAAFAKQMGHQKALEYLVEILAEEKMTDEKLTKMAETTINKQAQEASDGKYAM
jgi:ferritin-like metal-binding protein YciE